MRPVWIQHILHGRRLFTLVLTILTIAIVANLSAQPDPKKLMGPMIGHTDHTTARVWVGYNKQAQLAIAVDKHAKLSNPRVYHGPLLKKETGFTGTMTLKALKPDTEYFYAIVFNGKRLGKAPYPSFRTAPMPNKKQRLRIAFGSCNGPKGASAAAAFKQLAETGHADIMLQLGDNHYGDTTDLQKQRKNYAEHRSHPDFKAISGRIPFYGIWDDHDFGPNDSDGTAKGKENVLKAFKEHWPNPGAGEKNNPGIYFTFARNGIRFIALDGRYHRDPNKSKNKPTKTLLGVKQKAWLKKQLRMAKEKVKIVMCGSQFQLNGREDSFTSFKHEQKDILDFIKKNNIEGVLLLSGDRHYGAAYQIGGRVIEITSSPMGSKTKSTGPLPDMFMSENNVKMIAVLDIDPALNPPKVKLEFHVAGKGISQEREFTWDEINGKKRIPVK